MTQIRDSQTNLNYQNKLRHFVTLFKDLQANCLEAGKLLVELHDASRGSAFADIKKRVPQASDEFLRMLLAIGRGKTDPRLLFRHHHVADLLAQKPIALQQKLLDGAAIPVYQSNNTVANKTLDEMSRIEYQRALGRNGGGVVPVQTQKRATNKRKAAIFQRATRTWVVKGDGVVFFGKDPFVKLAPLQAATEELMKASVKSLERTVKGRQCVARA